MLRRLIMVRLSVALTAVSPAGVDDLVDALRFVAVSTRFERGCLACSAWSEPDLKVHYVEEWATESDMRRRVESDRFTTLLSVLESGQQPRLQFDFVSTVRGLDYVMEVRDTPQADVPPLRQPAHKDEGRQ